MADSNQAPRRRFSSRERVAMYLAADGVCGDCGAQLEPGWHGDHIRPHSQGGPTDIINGQALCPACNLAKGDKYMELRTWQQQALERFRADNNDFLTVATPGAGKTTFALVAAKRLLDSGEVSRVVVIAPTSHLRRQWAEAAAQHGIHLDHRFDNGCGALARDYHGVVVTYHAVASEPMLWRKLSASVSTLVILDEIHHAGDEHNWGKAIRNAFEVAHRRLLLSGTPFRSDNTAIPFVNYDSNSLCIPGFNYDYGQALVDRNVVRPVEFRAFDGAVKWRNAGAITETKLGDADDQTLANALRSALKPDGDWISSVLKTADAELDRQRVDAPDAGGLVVAGDQYKARAYAELLGKISGQPASIAISDDPEASKRIAEFAKGSSKWIVAVQMVSEGVDIPRLAVGVYATNIRTEMFFRQVTGRFVRMRGGEDETYATMFVPSIQPLLRFAQNIEATVERALAEEEEQVRRELNLDSGDGMLPLDLVEPLESSEAAFHSSILSGESFTDAELRRAEALAVSASMPTNTTPAQVARLLRLAGQTATAAPAAASAPAEAVLGDQKKSLRTLIKRKVGKLAKMRNVPYDHIHAGLNRQVSESSIKVATMETLNKRLEVLDKWITEA